MTHWNVRTYIQSGNVVFESAETSDSHLSEAIEHQIQEVFGFEGLQKLRPYAEGLDKLRLAGKGMYVLYEVSVSQSALFKVSFDKILGTPLTTRNWNTVHKLAAIGGSEPPQA